MAETLRGVVKWFNDAKGFGFIEHTSGRDVFVHYSVIEWDGFKTLKDGEEVDYELKEGEKGLHAARVGRPNAKRKLEKADGVDIIAPNLESGSVATAVRTAASMIEVEREDSTDLSDDDTISESSSPELEAAKQ